jgi:membrane fusion protein (multidrug efflux system)
MVETIAPKPSSRLEPPHPIHEVKARPRVRRRLTLPLMLSALLILATLAGAYYYAGTQSYESTDDAFIDGHIIRVAPQIAGRVQRVLVNDNQLVHQGDLVLEIDPRDAEAQLRQKQAILESNRASAIAAQASVDGARANVRSQQATVEQDQADVDSAQAQADQAADNLRRIQDLFAKKAVSSQDLINAQDANRSAQANLNSARKKVVAAQALVSQAEAQVNTFEALLRYVQAQIQEGEANVQTAELSDSYTKIFAPVTGRVTKKAVEPGDYVQIGQALLALVQTAPDPSAERLSDSTWVTANFKETQLKHMRPAQPVEISVDSLGGRKFSGHVNSIQAGSGAWFSLLPPENATGNYVKVVQRVPVKILFDETPDTPWQLGPGESVVPTVHVEQFGYSLSSIVVLALVDCLLIWVIFWRFGRPKFKPSK